MKGVSITPAFSATMASEVYALTKLPTIEEAIRSLNLDYGEFFNFSKDNLLVGKTGGPSIIKCKTGFGFCLLGKGLYKGHAFILFRGTQYLADWLTNLNSTVSRSCNGQSVHDGFHQAYKSMQPAINSFLNGCKAKGITNYHCIGHSLGGAIATICAEWIQKSVGIKPMLYTFGSPRVGLEGFAQLCTSRLGGDRIYRAYHKTDIVPYIPPWPFFHTPHQCQDYFLPSPGIIPGAEYHDTRKYIESVGDKSWKSLAAYKPEQRTDASIALWLKQKGPVGVTITTMDWLSSAIVFVLKKVLKTAEWLISATIGTAATLMDRIAYILSSGVNLEENISAWVVYLIRKIASFLGYCKNLSKEDLNRGFIRTVFEQMQVKLNAMAREALSQALVSGRAV